MKSILLSILTVPVFILECHCYNVGSLRFGPPIKNRVTPSNIFHSRSSLLLSTTYHHNANNMISHHLKKPLSLAVNMEDSDPTATAKEGMLSRVLRMLKPKSSENMSTKDMLKKMGLATLLSYGFLSNISSVLCVSASWFTFSKRVRITRTTLFIVENINFLLTNTFHFLISLIIIRLV